MWLASRFSLLGFPPESAEQRTAKNPHISAVKIYAASLIQALNGEPFAPVLAEHASVDGGGLGTRTLQGASVSPNVHRECPSTPTTITSRGWRVA